MPSTLYSPWKCAFITSSTVVTNDAMISTNTGRRISGRTQLRISDTVTFDIASTSVVARPRPRPLIRVLETASSGHSRAVQPGPGCCSTGRPGRSFGNHQPSFFSAAAAVSNNRVLLRQIVQARLYAAHHRARG